MKTMVLAGGDLAAVTPIVVAGGCSAAMHAVFGGI